MHGNANFPRAACDILLQYCTAGRWHGVSCFLDLYTCTVQYVAYGSRLKQPRTVSGIIGEACSTVQWRALGSRVLYCTVLRRVLAGLYPVQYTVQHPLVGPPSLKEKLSTAVQITGSLN